MWENPVVLPKKPTHKSELSTRSPQTVDDRFNLF